MNAVTLNERSLKVVMNAPETTPLVASNDSFPAARRTPLIETAAAGRVY